MSKNISNLGKDKEDGSAENDLANKNIVLSKHSASEDHKPKEDWTKTYDSSMSETGHLLDSKFLKNRAKKIPHSRKDSIKVNNSGINIFTTARSTKKPNNQGLIGKIQNFKLDGYDQRARARISGNILREDSDYFTPEIHSTNNRTLTDIKKNLHKNSLTSQNFHKKQKSSPVGMLREEYEDSFTPKGVEIIEEVKSKAASSQ